MSSLNKTFTAQNLSETESHLIDHVSNAIKDAQNNTSKLPIKIYSRNFLDGYSGEKTRHLYNNICSLKNSNYLEIGTWKGSSLCSALHQNNLNCTVIDNFSYGGLAQKEELYKNYLSSYIDIQNIQFIDDDCFNIDISKLSHSKYNIYLYDGGHEVEDHRKALTYYIEALDNSFIFIVDDWNWAQVREGTFKAIQELRLNVAYSYEIVYPYDGPNLGPEFEPDHFWNGICIFVLSKPV